MTELRDTIHVNVEYYDGEEEGDVGHPYYVASCEEITASTDGETIAELLKNIREVIDLVLEVSDPEKDLNLVPRPRVLITLELPENYAQTA